MNREIALMEWNKVRRVYPICLLFIAGYVLIKPHPFFSIFDWGLCILGSIQGYMLALLLFKDTDSTRVYIFSRPYSRLRLFWVRWALGIAMQLLSCFAVLLTIGLGIRSGFQDEIMNSFYYPFIYTHDFQALYPLIFFSLFFYTDCVLYQIRLHVKSELKVNKPINVFVLFLFLLLGLYLFIQVPGVLIAVSSSLIYFYIFIVVNTIESTYASRQAFQQMEITSNYEGV